MADTCMGVFKCFEQHLEYQDTVHKYNVPIVNWLDSPIYMSQKAVCQLGL